MRVVYRTSFRLRSASLKHAQRTLLRNVTLALDPLRSLQGRLRRDTSWRILGTFLTAGFFSPKHVGFPVAFFVVGSFQTFRAQKATPHDRGTFPGIFSPLPRHCNHQWAPQDPALQAGLSEIPSSTFTPCGSFHPFFFLILLCLSLVHWAANLRNLSILLFQRPGVPSCSAFGCVTDNGIPRPAPFFSHCPLSGLGPLSSLSLSRTLRG